MNATLDGETTTKIQFDERIVRAIRTSRFSFERGTTEDPSESIASVRQFLADARYLPYADRLSDDTLGCAYTLMIRAFHEACGALYRPQEPLSDTEEYLSEVMPQVIGAANAIQTQENGHPEPDLRCLFRFLENIGVSDIVGALTIETLGWSWVLLRHVRKDLGITG